MSVLIGVFTGNGEKYESRQRLCQETWFGALQKMGHQIVFVKTVSMPVHDQCTYGLVEVMAEDGWDALPQKTRRWCQYALNRPSWTHIAKIDDDCYVDPCRYDAFLKTLTPEMQYVGGDVGGLQGLPPYASGGASYILGREAVRLVAEQMTQKTGCEDLIAGDIMRKASIRFHHDPRFVPFGMQMGWPKKDNDLVTSHALTEAAWMSAWNDS